MPISATARVTCLAAATVLRSDRFRWADLLVRSLTNAVAQPTVSSVQVVAASSRGAAEPSLAGSGRQRLQVTWSDGSKDAYPLAWLRDMCRCSRCAHSSVAASRLLPFRQLTGSSATALAAAGRSSDGRAVLCRWSDGHESCFDLDWLRGPGSLRDSELRRRHDDALLLGPHRVAWLDRSDGGAHLTTGQYDEIVSNDANWCDFLKQFRRTGAYLIKAAPKYGLCRDLVSKRQLVVRGTSYGPFWTVDVRPQPHDLAFTNTPLEPHSDLLFYSRPPQVIWFHCLKQAAVGGETVLCDGLAAANKLKQSAPAAFAALARIPVDHWAVGEDDKGYGAYRLANRTPVIRLDEFGDVHEILWNSTHRSYSSCSSADDLEDWYEAAAAFHHILDSPAYKMSHRLEPGDLLVVDNLRVMHGRAAFSLFTGDAADCSHQNKPLSDVHSRLLEGFYTDWDDMLSSYRAVEHKLVHSCS